MDPIESPIGLGFRPEFIPRRIYSLRPCMGTMVYFGELLIHLLEPIKVVFDEFVVNFMSQLQGFSFQRIPNLP